MRTTISTFCWKTTYIYINITDTFVSTNSWLMLLRSILILDSWIVSPHLTGGWRGGVRKLWMNVSGMWFGAWNENHTARFTMRAKKFTQANHKIRFYERQQRNSKYFRKSGPLFDVTEICLYWWVMYIWSLVWYVKILLLTIGSWDAKHFIIEITTKTSQQSRTLNWR